MILKIFKEDNINVTWQTIIVGRKLGFVTAKIIEDYATDYLIENYKTDNIMIIELAYGIIDDFKIDVTLQTLADTMHANVEEDSEEWQAEKRKWRYIELKKVQDARLNDEEYLQKIESIYCDFGHQEDLARFVVYMPSDPNDHYDFQKHSREENLHYLVKLFNNFLIEEQHELAKFI
jgi:hypothetical protein